MLSNMIVDRMRTYRTDRQTERGHTVHQGDRRKW